jgi:two-component system sensor histidine kinase TtrS
MIPQKRPGEDLAQREAELAHVTRLSTLGELIAGIAHELNQPLQSIALFAGACEESLRRGNAEPERMLQWARQIGEQARACGAIVARIRAFARKADGERTRFDVAELIRESVELLAPEARRCGVSVVLETESPSPEIVADRLQIQQVVVNLLRNAYEASRDSDSADRVVTVGARRHEGGVRVSVQDRGAGFAADQRERIFEPFYTTKRNGLGMGLVISRSIIEGHGGRLDVSPNADRGTTASFTLPRGERPDAPST